MAWKERDRQLRRMEAIYSNLDTCLTYLKEFSDIYINQHPAHAEFADNLSAVLITAQEMVTMLKDEL